MREEMLVNIFCCIGEENNIVHRPLTTMTSSTCVMFYVLCIIIIGSRDGDRRQTYGTVDIFSSVVRRYFHCCDSCFDV